MTNVEAINYLNRLMDRTSVRILTVRYKINLADYINKVMLIYPDANQNKIILAAENLLAGMLGPYTEQERIERKETKPEY